MTGINPTGFVIVVIGVALVAMLLLTVLRGHLPARVQVWIEKGLGVGYPLMIGLAFAIMAVGAFERSDTTSGAGLALGGVVMGILALRAAMNRAWRQ